MTTSSQLVATFILLNHCPHTQLLSLMRAFCYSAFLNKLYKQLAMIKKYRGFTATSSAMKNKDW